MNRPQSIYWQISPSGSGGPERSIILVDRSGGQFSGCSYEIQIFVEDRADLPRGGVGGVLTPAAAFGEVLVRRLRDAGLGIDDDVDVASLAGEPDA